MSDDDRSQRDQPEPPRNAAEAELSWRFTNAKRAPIYPFASVAISIAAILPLWYSGRVWYCVAWVVLLVLGLLNAYMAYDYWLGPGGITLKGPFATTSHAWSEFGPFRVQGRDIVLWDPVGIRVEFTMHTIHNLAEVVAYVRGHLPQIVPKDSADDR